MNYNLYKYRIKEIVLNELSAEQYRRFRCEIEERLRINKRTWYNWWNYEYDEPAKIPDNQLEKIQKLINDIAGREVVSHYSKLINQPKAI